MNQWSPHTTTHATPINKSKPLTHIVTILSLMSILFQLALFQAAVQTKQETLLGSFTSQMPFQGKMTEEPCRAL